MDIEALGLIQEQTETLKDLPTATSAEIVFEEFVKTTNDAITRSHQCVEDVTNYSS